MIHHVLFIKFNLHGINTAYGLGWMEHRKFVTLDRKKNIVFITKIMTRLIVGDSNRLPISAARST
jgi:hypothetical protein